MPDIVAYKCPNCGAPVSFDSSTQKMRCDFCGSEIDVETFKAYDNALKKDETLKETVWKDTNVSLWTDATLTMAVCRSCGGELIMESTTIASECPYCGNSAVASKKVTEMLRPDFVIPFKLDKEAAKAALRKFYKGKPLLPRHFKDSRVEGIMGTYIPFWLYDCNTTSFAVYDATKTSSRTSGNTRYNKTDHYMVTRSGSMEFNKIPADGLSKIDDTFMESLEPFKYNDLIPFSMAYLSGYMADKYDVTAEANQPRINARIQSSVEQSLKSTIKGYSTVTLKTLNINAHDAQVHYALFPVWMLSTNWKGKVYHFAMNGQTGKLIGTLPIDKMKASIVSIVSFLVFSIISFIILRALGIDESDATAIMFVAVIIAVVCALSFLTLLPKKKPASNTPTGVKQ